MEGKRPILVGTGLSSAIGRAFMQKVPSNWRIVALGRTDPQEDRVEFLSVDLRAPFAQWIGTVDAWLHNHEPHPIAGFVHLAGIVYSDRTERTTPYEWESMLQVNLSSAFCLGQRLSPYFSSGSSVVLVSSIDAWHQSRQGPAAAYGASKAGLLGLMRQWASEWGSRGVRVNAVAPGALTSGNGPQTERAADAVTASIALRRLGTPEDVASVMAFLLAPESSYVTGCWIPVDGGLNIGY